VSGGPQCHQKPKIEEFCQFKESGEDYNNSKKLVKLKGSYK